MSGYIGPLPVPQGIQRKQSFTATASQTTFNTNGYTDGDFINVYLNGVRLINGTDYTATNGSDIVLTTGASASDVLDFETFQTFQLVDQQFENVTLKNPTHEDTDGGRESAVSFKGEQSGGEISTLAQIQASHDGTSDDQKGDLIFKTNDGSDNDAPTERARLDSTGALLVGTTTSRPAEFSHPDGFAIRGDVTGQIQNTVTDANCALFNRDGTDGNILGFRKEGTDVGSIGANNGRVAIYSADAGLHIASGILPSSNTGARSDNAVDIGNPNFRFKDLYLSGGAYLGGTVAANKLDEYEEGTWNPTVNVGSESSFRATYVKVGDFVWVSANLGDITETSSTSDVQIGGLPYTSHADNQSTGSVMFRYLNAPTNYIQLTPLVNPSSTDIIFYWSSGAGATWDGLRFADVNGSSPWDMIVGIGYRAA